MGKFFKRPGENKSQFQLLKLHSNPAMPTKGALIGKKLCIYFLKTREEEPKYIYLYIG